MIGLARIVKMNYKKIQNLFDKVIAYSQPDCREPHTDTLFETWQQQKEHFLKCFNGEPIITIAKDITFELSQSAKEEQLNKFMDWVEENYSSDIISLLRENFDSIFENKLSKEYKEYPIGMKLSKVLVKEFGTDVEDLRNYLSRLIQSQKVCGDVCMSVHPLDFLSLSESNSNWRSCHALDGEYRGGNISYMCDNNSFIVYLRSKEESVLPHFPEDVPWNSKKWRVLIFWDKANSCFWAGKQYPFSTDDGLNYAKQGIIKYLLISNYTQVYNPELMHWFSDAYKGPIKINGAIRHFSKTMWLFNSFQPELAPLNKYICANPEAVNYNDILYGSTFRTSVLKYRYPYNFLSNDVWTAFTIGAPGICCSCGKKYIVHSESVVCDNCLLKSDREDIDDICHCCSCGARIFEDDSSYVEEYGRFCKDCYKQMQFVNCSYCDGTYSLTEGEIDYNEDGKLICNKCFRQRLQYKVHN